MNSTILFTIVAVKKMLNIISFETKVRFDPSLTKEGSKIITKIAATTINISCLEYKNPEKDNNRMQIYPNIMFCDQINKSSNWEGFLSA